MSRNQPLDLLGELQEIENAQEPARQGQRCFRRFHVRGTAEMRPIDTCRLDRSPVEVQLRDVSRGGVGFVSAQTLPVGSTWRICFLYRGYIIGHQPVLVRHCRRMEGGAYLVGGQFCLDTVMFPVLGIDPGEVEEGDHRSDDMASFVPPEVS
ncbi:MAG: PilZ domain-containing protein [Phycisphaeraceae bacterium]